MEKMVIYKNWNGTLMVTTEGNYLARIQNARLINEMKGFETPTEVVEYYCKWFGSKPEDFRIID